MLFFDNGQIPYKSFLRLELYKIFPKKIRLHSNNVKVPGRVLFSSYSGSVLRAALSSNDSLIGNIYQVAEEVAQDFITALSSIYGPATPTRIAKIGDSDCFEHLPWDSKGDLMDKTKFPSGEKFSNYIEFIKKNGKSKELLYEE